MGKLGIINKKGEFVVAPKYDTISNFSNGYAKAQIEAKSVIFNAKGEIIP